MCLHQIEAAGGRGDVVSVRHRGVAPLASYFDGLFGLHGDGNVENVNEVALG